MRHFSVRDPLVKILVIAFLFAGIAFMAVFAYFYIKYERVVDRRMAGGIFSNAAKIYARPRVIAVGEKLSAEEVAADLRRAGYAEGSSDSSSAIGHYSYTRNGLEVVPGPQSYHDSNRATIRFSGGKVASISESGENNQDLSAYELEPQLGDRALRRSGPLQARAHQVRRHSAGSGQRRVWRLKTAGSSSMEA